MGLFFTEFSELLAISKLRYGYSQIAQKMGARFFIIRGKNYTYMKGEARMQPVVLYWNCKYHYKHMGLKYIDIEVIMNLRTQT